MKAVQSKGTKLETVFRRRAWARGFRYRKNSAKYFGKPDLMSKKHKLVVFLDSCFWHGCPLHCRMPSANKKYWSQKISGNKKRDNKVNRHYKQEKWTCMRFWEHQLKTQADIDTAVDNILSKISSRHNQSPSGLKGA